MDDLRLVIPELDGFDEPTRYQVELDVKYEGYIHRQDRQVSRFEKLEDLLIPENFDYGTLEGLSSESREKLKLIKPRSVGQASRINGVRTSDLGILILHVGKGGRHGNV
jgi:tRNA uridine 5-carboxymethylaminomethyl modification enzyme